MSTSERPPFVLLGAAASLISVLGFLGINGLADDPEQTGQSVNPATAGPGPTTYQTTTEDFRPATEPTRRSADPTTETTTPAADEVTCTIVDELGDRQTAENVLLKIGGQTYRMSIGAGRQRQQVRLRYTRPAAELDYTVMVSTRFDDGSLIRGGGRGQISCTGGETYALAGDYSSDPSHITLERS